MLTLVVENQSHGTFTHLRGKLVRRLAHDAPSYSRVGASGKPGAVQFGGLKSDQVKRLKDLEKENERLRKAVSDLTLEKLILREAASGNF